MALVPIIGVALEHQAVARHPGFQDEGSGADRIAIVIVAEFLDRGRRMDRVVHGGRRYQRRQIDRRIAQLEGDGQIVDGFDLVDELDVEGAAAVIVRVLLPGIIEGDGLGVERRAVVKLHARPQLEGPGLVIVGMAPGLRELRHRLAAVVQRRQCVEDERRRGLRRGVVDADLERIEAGNVELEPDGDAAAGLLRRGGVREHADHAGDQRGAGDAAQNDPDSHGSFLPVRGGILAAVVGRHLTPRLSALVARMERSEIRDLGPASLPDCTPAPRALHPGYGPGRARAARRFISAQ